MKNIFNLVIYIGIIYLLVELANKLLKNTQEKKIKKKDEKFTEEKVVVRGNPTIHFDYENVPLEEEKEPIETRYEKELTSGAFVYPQYDNNKFTDQRAIYNNDMYAKPIHINRTLDPLGDNDLPKTIAQIFDESITDFKTMTPLKTGQLGDFVVQGASNLSAYNPDYITYDDEKPENGAIFGKDDRYRGNLTVQAYDNMVSLDSAVF